MPTDRVTYASVTYHVVHPETGAYMGQGAATMWIPSVWGVDPETVQMFAASSGQLHPFERGHGGDIRIITAVEL